MVQHLVTEGQENQGLKVHGLKEIKRSRRTVILGGAALNLPSAGDDGIVAPLTPPMSERASGDVEALFSPEREEHYESVDLSSEDEGDAWNQSEHHYHRTSERV